MRTVLTDMADRRRLSSVTSEMPSFVVRLAHSRSDRDPTRSSRLLNLYPSNRNGGASAMSKQHHRHLDRSTGLALAKLRNTGIHLLVRVAARLKCRSARPF